MVTSHTGKGHRLTASNKKGKGQHKSGDQTNAEYDDGVQNNAVKVGTALAAEICHLHDSVLRYVLSSALMMLSFRDSTSPPFGDARATRAQWDFARSCRSGGCADGSPVSARVMPTTPDQSQSGRRSPRLSGAFPGVLYRPSPRTMGA